MVKKPSEYIEKDEKTAYMDHFMQEKYLNCGHNMNQKGLSPLPQVAQLAERKAPEIVENPALPAKNTPKLGLQRQEQALKRTTQFGEPIVKAKVKKTLRIPRS